MPEHMPWPANGGRPAGQLPGEFDTFPMIALETALIRPTLGPPPRECVERVHRLVLLDIGILPVTRAPDHLGALAGRSAQLDEADHEGLAGGSLVVVEGIAEHEPRGRTTSR